MKRCAGTKKEPHEEIIFVEWDYSDLDFEPSPLTCPLCSALSIIALDYKTIQEEHEKALSREDYIAKIETQNTKLEEALKSKNPSLFTYETYTWDNLPPVKPSKRSHKKKSTPKEKDNG